MSGQGEGVLFSAGDIPREVGVSAFCADDDPARRGPVAAAGSAKLEHGDVRGEKY